MFTSILFSIGDLIWTIINSSINFYSAMFDEAPVETTIITAIVGLKFTGLGGAITTAMANSLLREPLSVFSLINAKRGFNL